MTKKQISKITATSSIVISLIVVFISVLCGWVGYSYGTHKNSTNTVPTVNKAGYIVAQQASDQVINFYQQYIRSGTNPEFRSKLVASYGSKNLAFYNTYYQHGFDPIVCSTVMPTSVTAGQVTTGPSATVNVTATYPDKSQSTIVASVVINNDGLKVDSLTCPGTKAGLPPQ